LTTIDGDDFELETVMKNSIQSISKALIFGLFFGMKEYGKE
jgi:hypothetical protein